MSTSIAHCLTYGQNQEKGGECFFSQDFDPSASPEQQAQDWENLSNGYKRNIVHIILSFSDRDTKELRRMHPRDMVKRERELIMAFFRELKSRGNDITECPYGVFHHGNTDNEHFHIYVLMTTRKGKRWNNSFIRKNAIRAAAKVSLDYGLEGSKKAMQRELAHQRSRAYRQQAHRHRSCSNDQQTIDERMRRAESVRQAEQRKLNCKTVLEKIMACDGLDVVVECRKYGMELFRDPKLGVAVKLVDGEGKEHRYALKKHLNMDDSLVSKLEKLPLPTDYVSLADKKRAETRVEHRVGHSHTSPRPTPAQAPIIGHGLSRVLNVKGGSRSEQTQQGNENPDGSISQNDDLDEQWRRQNGYHM